MEIKIQHLIKQYGKNTVLDIPELTIGSGELVGLVGNNGAGKTTLMRLILDLIEATEGSVEIDGQRVSEEPAWKEFTGSFIDGRFLIDFYTPEEYFAFIARSYGIDKDTLDSRLGDYQGLMHDEILGTKKYLRQFSEGNRQKTGIIGAMIVNPKVLILDEPFNYLDPSSQITVTCNWALPSSSPATTSASYPKSPPVSSCWKRDTSSRTWTILTAMPQSNWKNTLLRQNNKGNIRKER